MSVTEVQELFAGELSAIVGDDDIGYPKPMDDDGEEEDGLLRADICDGSSLDPFGKFCRRSPTNGCILLLLSVEALRGQDPTPRTAT